jgi:predicted RNase H-like HicB family nuclease
VKLYRLPVTLSQPSEDSGGKFVAEVLALPGCRAWGESAAQAIENLQSVASAFLDSYREHGDPLPPEVEARAEEVGSSAVSEVLVAV